LYGLSSEGQTVSGIYQQLTKFQSPSDAKVDLLSAPSLASGPALNPDAAQGKDSLQE
jgi:hypothetical protein